MIELIIEEEKPVELDINEQIIERTGNDYNKLVNKPTLNGVEIVGDMEEKDPTVPSWAKQPEKPKYTAAEVGALPANTDLSIYAKKEDIPTTLPASDVYEWAKEENKPSYTASEVGALPSSTFIPTKASDVNALPADTFIPSKARDIGALPDTTFIPKTASDVGALPDTTVIPTTLPASDVYDWAKEPEKPSYTAEEVGALPDSTEIPVDVELTKAEYDALPSTKLTDGKHYLITDYSEGGGSGGGSQLNYSTEEQDTGIEWFDGRHVFQKSYIFDKPQVQYDGNGRYDLVLMDWDSVELCWVKESIFKVAESYMNLIYPAADSSGRLVASTRLMKVNDKLVLRFFGGEYWSSIDGRYLYLTIHYVKK